MNKNKNSDYNIIFENPNLLNYFTIGSIFDTSQVQLFENEEISLVNNLNIQETLDVNFFDISGKKFSKKMPDYKQSLIIKNNDSSAFNVSSALLILYASIYNFNNKFKNQKVIIENILNLKSKEFKINELNEYIFIKKLENHFNLNKSELTKFVQNKDELDKKLTSLNFIIDTKDILTKGKKSSSKIVDRILQKNDLFLNEGDNLKIQDKEIITKWKELIINSHKEFDEIISTDINRFLNSSNQKEAILRNINLIKELVIFSENKNNKYKNFFLIKYLENAKELKSHIKNISFKKSLEEFNLSNNNKRLFDAFLNQFDKPSKPIIFNDLIDLNLNKHEKNLVANNLIELNMITNNNRENLKIINNVRKKEKLEQIYNLFNEDTLTYYFEKAIFDKNNNFSFSKINDSNKILSGHIYNILNKPMPEKLVDKITNIIVENYNNPIISNEYNFLWSIQNKNPEVLENIINKALYSEEISEKSAIKLFKISFETALREKNINDLNNIIHYAKFNKDIADGFFPLLNIPFNNNLLIKLDGIKIDDEICNEYGIKLNNSKNKSKPKM